eukprot:XP_017951249.1 PREDICTED: uncharacterized protein LOC100488359 [Xenopus tropicalis]
MQGGARGRSGEPENAGGSQRKKQGAGERRGEPDEEAGPWRTHGEARGGSMEPEDSAGSQMKQQEHAAGNVVERNNDLNCFSCISPGRYCDKEMMRELPCRGEQKQCVDMRVKGALGDISDTNLKGCANFPKCNGDLHFSNQKTTLLVQCCGDNFCNKQTGKLIQGWIVRECGTSHNCFDALSFTNGTTVILMSVKCCVLDICLLEDPPSKGKQPKKPLKCEACYENGQSECYTNKTMVCDGEHSKCASISYSSTDTTNNKVTEQFFTRGCAEEKKCSNKTITAQVGNTKYQFGYTCNGCSGLYFSPLMLVLAAISMIKLI